MTRTVLEAAQLEAALASWPVGRLLASERLEAGTINSNYRVVLEGDDGAARTLFLRVNEGKTADDVDYEVELVTALASAGVPTPTPVRTRDGAGYAATADMLICLFPWLPGTHRSAEEVTTSDAARLGRALAIMHRASEPLLPRFDRAGIYTTAHIATRFESFRHSSDAELAGAIEIIAAELEFLETHRGAREALPMAIIHGDLFRDNVLWDGLELVALIDFEQASRGAPLYDLAVCLNAWCFRGGDFDLELARAMIDGYRAERALPEATGEALLVECRAAAMRFAVTRVTDIHLAGLAREGKSFGSYIARLERWRELGAGALEALM